MAAAGEHFDVFVSCSFSSKVNYDTGEVDPNYREYVEGILRQVRGLGLTAFCAIEYEGWRIGEEPPEVGVDVDLDTIDVSDMLLVLIGNDKSDGRSDEQGYARGKGIPVYFMKEPDVTKLSYWNQGLVNAGRVTLVESVDNFLYKEC